MPNRFAMPPKYRIVHELGSGGMGKVYKGLVIGQAGFQRPVVMKALRDTGDAGQLRLLVQEARRYALLDHDNIGRIFDFEKVGGQLCIILEYIDGWSLVDYVERHRELGRLPDVELSVFIVSRVCRALQYVYEQAAIVHRDVSPSNIMMTREGTVKLIDFGIATRAGAKERSLTGKPAYMAPEMVLELRADNRSDGFSLGAVFFEILTLERLFRGKTASETLEHVMAGRNPSPRQYNPHIPDGVMEILRKALQRDPERRYAGAGEMGQACEHHLYDKGYGPTNLTLKGYLRQLFPTDARWTSIREDDLPTLEPLLLPVEDATPPARKPDADKTPVARPAAGVRRRGGTGTPARPGTRTERRPR